MNNYLSINSKNLKEINEVRNLEVEFESASIYNFDHTIDYKMLSVFLPYSW